MACTVRREQIHPISAECDVVPGRSGHRMVCIAGDLYVIGGYVQSPTGLKVSAEVWAFNLIARRWRRLKIPNCPFRLALSTCALVVGECIIIHGGTGFPFAEDINNSIIEINVVTEQCKEHPCVPKNGDEVNIPEATYGHSLTYVRLVERQDSRPCENEAMLIKVGGARGAPYTNVVSAFYFSTGTWERLFGGDGLDSLGIFKPRYRHDAIFWREELYIIGGTNSEGSLPFWPMPVFNIRKRTWRYVSFSGSCPPPIRHSCSVHFDNVVYTTGGVVDENDVLNDLVFAFDLNSLVFYTVARQPLPTFFHDLAVVPGRNEFYSFGGVREETRVNHLHCFRLTNRTSSLAELCWGQVARLLRVFFPHNLVSPLLPQVLRSASAPLLGLSPVGSTGARDCSLVLSYLGQIQRKQRRPSLNATSDSKEAFFESLMAACTDIVNSSGRWQMDPVERVSLFLTVLFYYNGAPLQYVTRLPYGFRCMDAVCRYMEKLPRNENSEYSGPQKRVNLGPP